MFNYPDKIRLFCLIALIPLFLCAEAEPLAVYVTYQGDPHTAMTVQWITGDATKESDSAFQETMLFRQQRGPWQRKSVSRTTLPNSYNRNEAPYYLHRVELTNLAPGTTYEFKVNKETPAYKFRTLPEAPPNGLRFIVGGDTYSTSLKETKKAEELFTQMNKAAASLNPHFVLLGGDLAYAHSLADWIEWIQIISRDLISCDGRLIPIISAIGNHDCAKKYNADIFQALFPSPSGKTYYTLDITEKSSIFILDTNHGIPIEGEQTNWLINALQEREEIPLKMAVYHVPAYPGYRSANNSSSVAVRKHWLPHFEVYGLLLAFEHHDHIYKRTKPLRNGVVDNDGIVFLGDGAWGVDEQNRKPEKRWYLEELAQKRHFFMVTIRDDSIEAQAIDDNGIPFDSCLRERSQQSGARSR